MSVTTSRFASAIASLVAAAAAFITAKYFVDDQATAAFVAAIATAITGILVPASAAKVGTVDAMANKDK